MAEIKLVSQVMRLEGIGEITMTDPITQEPDTGLYLKVMRVFGTKPDDDSAAPLLFTAFLTSETENALVITGPQMRF